MKKGAAGRYEPCGARFSGIIGVSDADMDEFGADPVHGGGTAQGLDAGDKLCFRLPNIRDGLHQQSHRIYVSHTLPDHIHHIVPQASTGFMQTRRIHKDKLALSPCQNTADAVPSGLGLVGNDSYFLPHQGVYQCGLAYVGPAAQGNDTGFFDNRHKIILTFSGVNNFPSTNIFYYYLSSQRKATSPFSAFYFIIFDTKN